jgi:hypothetical protein
LACPPPPLEKIFGMIFGEKNMKGCRKGGNMKERLRKRKDIEKIDNKMCVYVKRGKTMGCITIHIIGSC